MAFYVLYLNQSEINWIKIMRSKNELADDVFDFSDICRFLE